MIQSDQPASSHTETATGTVPSRDLRSRRRAIGATLALALLWPLLQAAAYGSFDALLSVGPEGRASAAVRHDIADLHFTDEAGHDGQQFYVVARHPFDPIAAGTAVKPLTYRYRRILFPVVAGGLVPGGGRGVIIVFLLESLVGVALGAWALSRLPGAPRWLPIAMAATPGVAAALALSLCDALGAGLALMAVALSMRGRWRWAILCLILAALTRETLLIVAVGLAFTPNINRRIRVLTVGWPVAVLGLLSLWVARAAGESSSAGGAQQLALPFFGWMGPQVPASARFLGAVTLALLLVGAWRGRRRWPQVSVMLALGAAMMASYSELVAYGWVNGSRPVAPLVPLAVWILTAGHPLAQRPSAGLSAAVAAPKQDRSTTSVTPEAAIGPYR